MKELVNITKITLTNKGGRKVPSVRLTCPRCGDNTECFGTRGRSIHCGINRLWKGCKQGEKCQLN